MDVADKCEKVVILIAENRLEAVFKEMSGTIMATVEGLGVPSKKFAHYRRNSQIAALKQNVDMGVHKDPGVYGCSRFCNVFTQALQKSGLIFIVRKYCGFVYPSHHDVMQGTRNVEAGLSWHGLIIVVR
jgi:hypothetical protein